MDPKLLISSLLLLLTALAGCGSAPEPNSERRLPGQPDPSLISEEPAPFVLEGYVDYIQPERAEEARELKVQEFSGVTKTLKFGEYPVPTVLFFWDCGHYYSVHAAKFIQQLQDEMKRERRPFRIIGIIMKREGTPSAYRDFLRRTGIGFRNYFDNSRALERMAESDSKAIVPAFFIIDQKGRLRVRKGGFKFVLLEIGSRRRPVYREDVGIRDGVLLPDPEAEPSRQSDRRRIKDFIRLLHQEQS